MNFCIIKGGFKSYGTEKDIDEEKFDDSNVKVSWLRVQGGIQHRHRFWRICQKLRRRDRSSVCVVSLYRGGYSYDSVMQDPETDGEGKEEDKEAVTDRPDPTSEDVSEALAVLNRVFFKCCIYENV